MRTMDGVVEMGDGKGAMGRKRMDSVLPEEEMLLVLVLASDC
jgi:hypothetical protein